ncbi:hypothetical protein BSZ32_15895 [Rubritalea profundi]|uniref:Type II secretion system protein GspG C-terminal domain-containing protein n=2 Tax=Rubritalea profundi TaxID=1658618 RepID=A0A2S7U471_9BACT|nr:hypothetical protein BSZ32_15895 [Rubritalea profundi]
MHRPATDIMSFEAHILQYRNTTGKIPSEKAGLQALVERPKELGESKTWNKSLNSIHYDPWGNPYQ